MSPEEYGDIKRAIGVIEGHAIAENHYDELSDAITTIDKVCNQVYGRTTNA